MLRTKHSTGSSFSFLSVDVVGDCPLGDWREELEEIVYEISEYYGILFLDRTNLAKNLSLKTKIPTCFKKKGYHVFDALFYYDDGERMTGWRHQLKQEPGHSTR